MEAHPRKQSIESSSGVVFSGLMLLKNECERETKIRKIHIFTAGLVFKRYYAAVARVFGLEIADQFDTMLAKYDGNMCKVALMSE